MRVNTVDLTLCPHCDTVHRTSDMPMAQAFCVRCGARLVVREPVDLDRLLAFTLAALLLFLLANAFPIVELQIGRERTQATLWEAIQATYTSGVPLLAVLAAATVMVFPLVLMLLSLHVYAPLRAGRRPWGMVAALHGLRLTRPWSMVEVFMLGVLVAVVKLDGEATVIIGPGLWAIAGLTALLTVLSTCDLHAVWDLAEVIEE